MINYNIQPRRNERSMNTHTNTHAHTLTHQHNAPNFCQTRTSWCHDQKERKDTFSILLYNNPMCFFPFYLKIFLPHPFHQYIWSHRLKKITPRTSLYRSRIRWGKSQQKWKESKVKPFKRSRKRTERAREKADGLDAFPFVFRFSKRCHGNRLMVGKGRGFRGGERGGCHVISCRLYEVLRRHDRERE